MSSRMATRRRLSLKGTPSLAKCTVGSIWKYCQKIKDYIRSSKYAKKHCVVHKPKFDLLYFLE